MNTGSAIRQGFVLARRSGVGVCVLFLANLALAALAALPLYGGMQRFTAHSLVARDLARGFSVDWLTDFTFNNPHFFDRFATAILAVGLVTLVLNSVLAGGVLGRFRTPDRKYSFADFFRGVAHYLGPLLRLLVIGLVCYWIVFKLFNEELGGWVARRTGDWMDDRSVFAARLAVSLLVLLGLGFVNLVMDYARVRVVLGDGTGALQAFLASLGFSLGRLGRAVAVYLIPSICGLALLAGYRLLFPWGLLNSNVAAASHAHTALALAGLFAVQQIVILGRYWFRVATWGSEWAYYRGTGNFGF